ncbi:MAG: NAD-dependent epimerase/dehydratase family protein [Oligoflexia bacterium]|nr:NAD-dependent epimerase/dehydratase family protein [Oligoflexia bacterium]
MKALVTGGSGFIGSTLIEELNRRGYDVYALLRKTSPLNNLESSKFTRVEGDLSDTESLKRAVRGMDYVFHVAGVVRFHDQASIFRLNAEGTRNVVEAVASDDPGIKRFVYVSSQAAGGPAASLEAPRTEAELAAPVSVYGQSKLQGEVEVLKYRSRFPVSIVRPPMVYGPRDKDVFTVIQTVSRRLMPLIRGGTKDGSKYYSLIHVRDLCRGIALAAEADPARVPSGEIFYLTDGAIYTYRELLLSMARALNVRAFSIQVPQPVVTALAGALSAVGKVTGRSFPLNQDKLNEIRPDYWVCSSEKAKDMLGFQAELNLSSGMQDAIRWYKDQKWI